MKKYLLITILIFTVLLSSCKSEDEVNKIFILGEGQDTVEINTSWIDSGAWLEIGSAKVDFNTKIGSVDTSILGLYQIERLIRKY